MKALVLAGGVPQIALLQELRSRGITTVLADYYEHPVARSHADIFYQVSTLDIPAITRVAREEKVDFLITVCTDQALLTVAYVSQQLGLPCYIDYETARNVTNKSYMKDIFREKNISSANFCVLEQLDESRIRHLRYPLIVKPVDCNSSKGVKKVTCIDELRPAFADAVGFSRTGTAIIEEFVEGPELSVDVYVEDGVAHVLAVSQLDKIPAKDKFVIFRSKAPVGLAPQVTAHIQQTAQQIADAFGLKNAPMLIQMISDGQQVYVLEFSARTGGGEKFITIEKISGFDVVKAVVDLTLGIKPHVDPEYPRKRLYTTEFIYCKPGIFHHLENFELLQQQGIIDMPLAFHSPGTVFDKIESSGDRVAGYIMTADTLEELERKHETAVAQLAVIDADGNDMMRRDLLPALY